MQPLRPKTRRQGSVLHSGEPAVGIVAVLRLLIFGVVAGEDVVGAVVAPTAWADQSMLFRRADSAVGSGEFCAVPGTRTGQVVASLHFVGIPGGT